MLIAHLVRYNHWPPTTSISSSIVRRVSIVPERQKKSYSDTCKQVLLSRGEFLRRLPAASGTRNRAQREIVTLIRGIFLNQRRSHGLWSHIVRRLSAILWRIFKGFTHSTFVPLARMTLLQRSRSSSMKRAISCGTPPIGTMYDLRSRAATSGIFSTSSIAAAHLAGDSDGRARRRNHALPNFHDITWQRLGNRGDVRPVRIPCFAGIAKHSQFAGFNERDTRDKFSKHAVDVTTDQIG